MEPVRFGIIGYGNMGSHHARSIAGGLIEGARLGAICDINPERLEQARAIHAEIPTFAAHPQLLESGTCDAVIIATPHYDHPPIALDAFAANHHVLSEKPAAVSVNAARKLNAEYDAKYRQKLKFGIMFQQRAYRIYQKLKDVLDSGELGEIRRVTWLVTDWFRTWAYYASGGWRATWAGGGGGGGNGEEIRGEWAGFGAVGVEFDADALGRQRHGEQGEQDDEAHQKSPSLGIVSTG